jgi:hypothetical protein
MERICAGVSRVNKVVSTEGAPHCVFVDGMGLHGRCGWLERLAAIVVPGFPNSILVETAHTPFSCGTRDGNEAAPGAADGPG